jgi:uncharacterized membrane protein YeaQ/YmgE (transglycosylase-associated protein family)
MATVPADMRERRETIAEIDHEIWHQWPVNWTAVWIGALAALAMVLILGLIGVAIGAHLIGPENRVVDLKDMSRTSVVTSVIGAFLAFVVGGWATGKVAGLLYAESAMLHGAVMWLLSLPLMIALLAMGASGAMNAWYGGIAAGAVAAPYERPVAPIAGATPEEITNYRAALTTYNNDMQKWREETPRVARNSALGAVTALLLGLMGSVIGGWLATAGQHPEHVPIQGRGL